MVRTSVLYSMMRTYWRFFFTWTRFNRGVSCVLMCSDQTGRCLFAKGYLSVFTLAPINHGTNLRCYVMMNCWVSYSTSWERKQMQKVGFSESHINVDKSSHKSTPERLADSSSLFYLRKDTAIDSQTRSTDETKTVRRLLWYHHADSVCAIH